MKISNERITLRAPELEDIDTIFRHENSFEEPWQTTAFAPVSRLMIENFVKNYSADIREGYSLRLMIEDEESGKVAGSIDLYDYNSRDRRAYVSIFIEKSFRHKGVGLKALRLLCEYAERVLGLHQLAAEIAAENIPSRGMFEKAGFKSCGRLRSWLRSGRRYYDVIVYQHLFFN